VTDHRANRFEIIFRKLFTARLAAKQNHARHFTAHDHRQHEFDAFGCKFVAMSIDEAVRDISVTYQQFTCFALEKRILLCVVDLKAIEHLITKTPERRATKWTP